MCLGESGQPPRQRNQNPLALVAKREIDRGRELLPDSSMPLNLLADGLDRGMRPQEPEGQSFCLRAESPNSRCSVS